MVKPKHTDVQPVGDEQPSSEHAATYTKQQFIVSSKYAAHRDVLSALLKDDETYTTEKVDQLLSGFFKKEAK